MKKTITITDPMQDARDEMEAYHRDALPLTELRLVPVKDDEQ